MISSHFQNVQYSNFLITNLIENFIIHFNFGQHENPSETHESKVCLII